MASSVRLEKLKSLLKRVEERRAKPRLHAVAAPRAAAPAARTTEELFAAPPPAAPEPARPAAKSPLEDAIGDFGTDALDARARALAEPITTPKGVPRAPEPVAPREPEPLVTYRPEPVSMPARPSLPTGAPIAPVVPLQIATASTNLSSKVTLEFGVPRIELPPAPVPVGDLPGPTQTIESAPLAGKASPARAVSAAHVETPKSFGELLELSLALRPR
jgi:hypothetical protein